MIPSSENPTQQQQQNTNIVEACLLSNNIYDYRIVSQGKTTIPSVDDGSEFEDTDVRIGHTNYGYLHTHTNTTRTFTRKLHKQ